MSTKPVLLNESFSIHKYNGGKEQEGYEIENILDLQTRPHCSSNGKNFSVCLKYNGKSETFSLSNFTITGGTNCSEPLKNGLLFVSDHEITNETMSQYKNFTKEKFESLKKNSHEEPVLYFETDRNSFDFQHEFKGKFLEGKFIGILFISTFGKGDNIDVQHVGLVGFDGNTEKYHEVGEVSNELHLLKKVLKEGVNEFHVDLFNYITIKENLMLISGNDQQISDFSDVAENSEFKEKFTFFKASKDDPTISRLISVIGVSKFPCLIMFDGELRHKYGTEQSDKITKDFMLSFCKGFLDGKLNDHVIVKSAPRPKNDEDPKHPGIKILTTKSFKEIVFDETKDVLVDVYADWCGPCMAIAPTLYQLAESFQKSGIDSIVIGKIDSDANDVDTDIFPEPGIPNLKFFPQGSKDKPVKYLGDRSAKDFLKFLHENAKTKFDIAAVESKLDEVKKEHEKRALGKVVKIHNENEFNEAIQTDKLVVVDFTASWCGPCRYIAPKFSELSNQYENVLFLKVDVDEIPKLPQIYEVGAFPTFKYLKNSKVVGAVEGADPEALEEAIKKHQ
eukprot:gene10136-2555_t